MPANLAIKLYLNDELKIKILSKFLFFNSFVNLKIPLMPSISSLRVIISSIWLSSARSSFALELSFTNIETDFLYFLEIAWIYGR